MCTNQTSIMCMRLFYINYVVKKGTLWTLKIYKLVVASRTMKTKFYQRLCGARSTKSDNAFAIYTYICVCASHHRTAQSFLIHFGWPTFFFIPYRTRMSWLPTHTHASHTHLLQTNFIIFIVTAANDCQQQQQQHQ